MNQCDKSVTCNILKTCQSHRVLTLFEYITEERERERRWSVVIKFGLYVVPSLQNYLWKKYSHITIVIEVSHTTQSCPKNAVSLLAGSLQLCCGSKLSSLTHYWKNVSQALNGSNTKTKPKFKYLWWHFCCLFTHTFYIIVLSMSFWPLECLIELNFTFQIFVKELCIF